MKKFLFALLLSIMCVFVTGCASVDFSRTISGNGSIRDEYLITVEKPSSNVTTSNTAKTIFDNFYADASAYCSNLKSDYNQAMNVYFKDDPAQRDYYMNGLQILCRTLDNSSSYVAQISRTYANEDILNMFYLFSTGSLFPSEEEPTPPEEEEDTGYVLEEEYFVIHYATYSKNWFQSFMEDESNREVFASYMEGTEYTMDNFTDSLNITQSYICPSTKMHTNADSVEYDETYGYTKYQWNLTDDVGKDFYLKFYYNIPNATNWYILSAIIAGSVAVMLIVIAVGNYVKKKRAPKDQSNESN